MYILDPFGRVSRIEGKFRFVPPACLNHDRSVGFTPGAIPMAMFNLVGKDDWGIYFRFGEVF